MGIAEAIILIASIVTTTVTSIAKGVGASKDATEAGMEAKDMYNKDEEGRKEREAYTRRMNERQIQFAEKQEASNRAEARKDRRFKKEQFQFQKQEHQYDKQVNLLNQNRGMRQSYLNLYQRAA